MPETLESLLKTLEPETKEKIKEKINEEYYTPKIGNVCNSLSSQIAVLDSKGSIINVNKAWEKFAEVNGASTNYQGWNYIGVCKNSKGKDSENALTVAEGLTKIIEGKKPCFTMEYPCNLHTPEGEIPRWFYMKAVAFRENPSYVIVSHDDITKRKLAEEKIKKSKDWFETLFENTGSAILVSDKDTTIHMVNSRFEEFLGYKKKEIENKVSWTKMIPAEYKEKLKNNHYLRRLDEPSIPENYEAQVIDANGEKKDVLLSAKMIPNSERSIISLMDITQKKEHERLRDEAERIVRHDLKTPIIGIGGMANLLTMTNLDDEQKEYVDFIVNSATTMNEEINMSLDIVKMQKGQYQLQPEPFNIEEILKEIGQNFYSYIENGFSYNYTFNPDEQKTRFLYGEKKLIKPLLHNLIKNGFEAEQSKGSGRVDVAVSKQRGCDKIDIYNTSKLPEEVTENFFDKYNSFGKKNGTGLGTYSAYLITKAHNGSIDFNTNENGTHVYICLPSGSDE